LTYDVIVIGSGPGGYVAAIRAAQLGLATACVEKAPVLGGTCLNVGCIPSKALLHSTDLFRQLTTEFPTNGIQVRGAQADFARMMQRKKEIVAGFNQGIAGLFQRHKVDWITGAAQLSSPTTVEVGAKTLQGRHIILATGSEPIPLPFLPFNEKTILSSTGALALEAVPQTLAIIGAGIIGVELGSVYRRLGSEVIVVEFLDRICPALDAGMASALHASLEKQGLQFWLSHKVSAAQVGPKVELTVEGKEGKKPLVADAVLVAVGRRPYSEGLNLETLGISKGPKGFVEVDDCFRTRVPNIYAIGDLIPGPMLAHKASEEGIAVAELIAGLQPRVDYAAIPNVAYTHPEVAAVGFTEEELKQKQVAYKVGKSSFRVNSRARCTGEEEGFVKVLASPDSGRILGVHIIGAHASELISEAVFAIRSRSTALDLARTCNPHPTLSEALKEAAAAL
jgi:dihydrolipoamide dehydrogenase